MYDTQRTRKQTQTLEVIEECSKKNDEAKGLSHRLEKVEQDQPLPTYQRDIIDGQYSNSEKNEGTPREKNAEDKAASSAFMSPITQTSQLETTDRQKRQYVNNNLQRMIKLASKIDSEKNKKR